METEGKGEVGEKGGDFGIDGGKDGGKVDAEEGGGKREETEGVDDGEHIVEEEENEFVGFLLTGAEVIPQTEHAEEDVQKENGEVDVGGGVAKHEGSDTHHTHQDNTDAKEENQAPEVVVRWQLRQMILLHVSLSQFQEGLHLLPCECSQQSVREGRRGFPYSSPHPCPCNSWEALKWHRQ